MMLQYVLIFIAAIVLSAMKVSIWITYFVILTVFLLFRVTTNPLFFSKNTQRMMEYIRKSKQPNLKFLYLLFQEKFAEAEALLSKIRSEKRRKYYELILYTKQKKIPKAKKLLEEMINPVGNYYHAILALHEDDLATYEVYKKRVKNSTYRVWLEAEEEKSRGNVEGAIRILDEQLPKLRGMKLLSSSEYRKELERELPKQLKA